MTDTDLEIDQGATFSMALILYDTDDAVIDPTDWDFDGEIRSKYDAIDPPAAEFTFVKANVQDENGDDQLGILVTISDTDTSAIAVDAATNYVRGLTSMIYDIEATLPDATKIRIMQGTVTISPEVTK